MEITSDTSVYQIGSEGGDVDTVKFGETNEDFQNEINRLKTIDERLIGEIDKLIKRVMSTKSLSHPNNSGNLKRLQALVFIKSGLRRSLYEIYEDIKNGESVI